MTKIFSTPEDPARPRIENSSVVRFFSERAQKIQNIGSVRAVIYQDKDPELALRRDAAEKAAILPRLALNGTQRILDIGCGTGRWAEELIPQCRHYHGIDFNADFITYARERFSNNSKCCFTVASAVDFSLSALGETQPFDRVMCVGVLMYLNDEAMLQALRNISLALAPGGLALFREPMGVGQRLTILQHYSEDMDQIYNAIYRTREELDAAITNMMPAPVFKITGGGDMYTETILNNRIETRQKWITVERNV